MCVCVCVVYIIMCICVIYSENRRAVVAGGDRSVANTRRLSSWWGNTCLLLVLNSLSNYISSHTFILFLLRFLHAKLRLHLCFFLFLFSLICTFTDLLFYYRNLLLLFNFSFFPKKRYSQRDTCVFHEKNRRTVPKIDTRIGE